MITVVEVVTVRPFPLPLADGLRWSEVGDRFLVIKRGPMSESTLTEAKAGELMERGRVCPAGVDHFEFLGGGA